VKCEKCLASSHSVEKLHIVRRLRGYKTRPWCEHSYFPLPHSDLFICQRDNVLFGQPFDEERYWKVMEVACMTPDLQLLPDGDLTEVRTRNTPVLTATDVAFR